MSAPALAPALQPLSTGQLLDRAIRLYRSNFLTFLGIIALVLIPVTLLQWGSSYLVLGSSQAPLQAAAPTAAGQPDDLDILAPMLTGLAGSLLSLVLNLILVSAVGTAALTRAIGNNYLGQKIGILDAYRQIGRSWLTLLGALLLALLVGILLVLWFLVPCIGWLTGLGILFFFSSAVVPLIAPAVVLEGQRASGSVRRGWDLSRRRFWPVVGFVVVLLLLSLVLVSLPATLLSLLLGPSLLGNIGAYTAITTVINLLLSLIFVPFRLTALTLLYFDLRVRTEGFDLTVLANALEETPEEAADVAAIAPPPEKGNLITGNEMARFAALTIAGAVLYAIFATLFGGLMALDGLF